MATTIPDILARIVATKRIEVAEKSKLRKGLEQNATFQIQQRRCFRAGLLKRWDYCYGHAADRFRL